MSPSWQSENFVQWTPDGSTLLFTLGSQLYAVAADGSRLWQIAKPGTAGGSGRAPTAPFSIAPDGEYLVYATCIYPYSDVAARREAAGERLTYGDYQYELARMRIDGTEHVRLTENRRFDNYPAWSPDGARIAFLVADDGPIWAFGTLSLYSMAADGEDLRPISTEAREGVRQVGVGLLHQPPRWSPDGRRIAAVGNDFVTGAGKGFGGGDLHFRHRWHEPPDIPKRNQRHRLGARRPASRLRQGQGRFRSALYPCARWLRCSEDCEHPNLAGKSVAMAGADPKRGMVTRRLEDPSPRNWAWDLARQSRDGLRGRSRR